MFSSCCPLLQHRFEKYCERLNCLLKRQEDKKAFVILIPLPTMKRKNERRLKFDKIASR
jgi:hypothetical protein